MKNVRVVVGFRLRLVDLDDLKSFNSSEEKATYHLKQAPPPGLPGFANVLKRVRHLNAVIVSVDAAREHEFLTAAPSWDPIEYCDRDYKLRTASFGDSLASPYRPGADLAEVIARFHAPVASWASPYGLGTRIALLDTGISPHPFLPALSSSELGTKVSCFHPSIPRTKRQTLCAHIAQAEQASNVEGVGLLPIVSYSPAPDRKPIYGTTVLPIELEKVANAYSREAWLDWRRTLSDWMANGRKGPKPPIPAYRGLFGAARLLSPLSKSFLEGELEQGVLDFHGHGTRVAGVIAALRPGLKQVSVESQLQRSAPNPLLFDVVGLCPYAELVVLKCLHIEHDNDDASLRGSLVAMIDALSYCLDVDIDVLYIGLALRDAPYALPMSIANLLTQLDDRGTVIFAPAGNHSHRPPGLAFPASFASVHAITSVGTDSRSGALDVCDYSAIANPARHEKVAFCAFGGSNDERIITTNPHSGFIGDYGTSVAAAMAVGCYSAAASGLYFKKITQEYGLLVQHSGQVSVDQVEQTIAGWRETDGDRKMLLDTMRKSAVPLGGTSLYTSKPKFGYGLIRVPDPVDLA